MADVDIYVIAVGGARIANTSETSAIQYNWIGPYMVAFNLFKALTKYTQIDFRFHSILESAIKDARIVRCEQVEGSNIIHIMQHPKLASVALKNIKTCPIIIGPNVVNTFFGSLTPELSGADPLQVERAICHGAHALFLLPSVNADEAATAKEFGKKIQAFPSGIDTELFSPGVGEKDLDILILNKGPYSTPDVFQPSLAMGASLYDALRYKYATMMLNSYDFLSFPTLLKRTKVVIDTTPGETQGMAIMQAQAAGVPVIHRRNVPFQPRELAVAQVEYSIASFLEALPIVLAERKKLAEIGIEFIRTHFSLQVMAKAYEEILQTARR
jgi:hypothetical protein